jgi:hypothetical protein
MGASVFLFCGERPWRPVPADRRSDTGRILVGCSNPDCDVTGMEVLMTRDRAPRLTTVTTSAPYRG